MYQVMAIITEPDKIFNLIILSIFVQMMDGQKPGIIYIYPDSLAGFIAKIFLTL